MGIFASCFADADGGNYWDTQGPAHKQGANQFPPHVLVAAKAAEERVKQQILENQRRRALEGGSPLAQQSSASEQRIRFPS